jgi:hypothetical protein
MDCTLIEVFKEVNRVCLQSLLEYKKGCALHLQIRLENLVNLADKMLKGCLPDQKISALLVFMDLAKGNGSRAVTMGLLHAIMSWSGLMCSHCCKVLSWGLFSS